MIRKYILFAIVLLSCVSWIDNKDSFNGLTLKLSKYSIVNPRVVQRWKRNIRSPQSKDKHGEETVSYAVNINNRKHLLHLKKNRDFLHPNFVQYSSNATGNHEPSYPKQDVHCYYHGEVEGYDDSVVALSTCSGLRGVILLGNETYGLEPVPQSATNDHLLYLLKDSEGPVTCGVVDEASSTQSHEPFEPGNSLTSLLRRKRNLPQTSYVELVLVADHLRVSKQNESAVREEMVQMANLLDGYYKHLNIRVVLVGLEIFKDGNPFDVEGSAGEVLGKFVRWRKTTLLPKIRHDMAQLIVGLPAPYNNAILGMAFVGTVCHVANAGGINVFSKDNLAYVSTVVAHEMGHNLGMNHDADGCSCNDKDSCIMASTAGGSTSFSSCSERYFENLIIRGGGTCLKNQPSPSDVVDVAECGNGRLDKGEQCDCGKPAECNNKCCDAATCTFTSGAVCSQGGCCDNCQVIPGAPCRESVNTCDLSEYCNGKTEFCPNDFYVMDGLPCQDHQATAYCYEGQCQTYDVQCRNLFAPATKAADICFQTANIRGNALGNCGIDSNGQYRKCTVANSMCGKLHCVNVDLNTLPPGAQVGIEVVQGERCINADFHLGPDVLDPGYVNSGSPCDKGKTCLDFKCVNASALLSNLDCDAQTKCNNKGICNDQGNCHCDNGWAPPNCDKSGRGGSINSGPAQIDHSLRNGLLIFFLLVVPVLVLLILVLLYIFRRDSLKPCLKGRHMDYWNAEESAAPVQPPAPRQGPGVPKPIPPNYFNLLPALFFFFKGVL
uniref:ADAM metallopeptidase domain 9b n=1 Tax=Cyclopterus lumpus TaxID=8103 RepID=A0A8C2X1C3_CYCLU